MKIEISEAEIQLIDKALQSWENDATSGALMSSMFGMMLCPKDERESEKARTEGEFAKAEKEKTSRRIQATLLRAKLFQAQNRATEFDVAEVA